MSLWLTTWERIDKFLPDLKTELFPPRPANPPTEPPAELPGGQPTSAGQPVVKSYHGNVHGNVAAEEVLRKGIKSESVVTGK